MMLDDGRSHLSKSPGFPTDLPGEATRDLVRCTPHLFAAAQRLAGAAAQPSVVRGNLFRMISCDEAHVTRGLGLHFTDCKMIALFGILVLGLSDLASSRLKAWGSFWNVLVFGDLVP